MIPGFFNYYLKRLISSYYVLSVYADGNHGFVKIKQGDYFIAGYYQSTLGQQVREQRGNEYYFQLRINNSSLDRKSVV